MITSRSNKNQIFFFIKKLTFFILNLFQGSIRERNKVIGSLIIAALLFTFISCNDNQTKTDDITKGAKFRENSRKRIKKAEGDVKKAKKVAVQSVTTVDESKWNPEVLKIYKELLKMGANQKDSIISKVNKLAGFGPDAREALSALAGNTELPEPQEAMCGMNYPRYFRFDLDKLISLLDHSNKFTRGITAELLQNYGGKKAINALKNKIPEGGTVFGKKLSGLLSKTRTNELPLEANEQLHILINSNDKKELNMAAATLANYHIPAAENDLLELIDLKIANKDARTFASIALTMSQKDINKLKFYTERNQDWVLRYNAVLSIAKLGDVGINVLKKLAEFPDEPLLKIINDLIKEVNK